jgi:2-polyprenyl-3-methyl-5-hydroxy-6-metoxy-1,4-benzoquinol methylase
MSKKKSFGNHLQSNINKNFSATKELWDAEKFLINYNNSLAEKIKLFLNKKIRVLEFGAGIGNLSNLFFLHTKIKPECVEIDKSFRKVLISRGFKTYASLKETKKTYEAIYTSNVLEHIKDDKKSIELLYDALEDRGILIVYVPAFNFLFSDFDKNAGHYRRYSRNELITKIKRANFQILTASYVDSMGFIAAFLVKLLGYKNKYKLGSNDSLKFYDKYIWPVSQVMDKLGLKLIFGKNLFVVARKD